MGCAILDIQSNSLNSSLDSWIDGKKLVAIIILLPLWTMAGKSVSYTLMKRLSSWLTFGCGALATET